MVSLNSAEVNNKAAMSLRCFVLRNHSWENEKMRIWEFENFSYVKKSSPFPPLPPAAIFGAKSKDPYTRL